ncbi:hypothetical protein ACRRTK_020316 [Alexandromys fortis]
MKFRLRSPTSKAVQRAVASEPSGADSPPEVRAPGLWRLRGSATSRRTQSQNRDPQPPPLTTAISYRFTPQAQLLETAFKVYHARNDKAKNHCHVITAPAPHPVRAAPPPPGPCFKCGKTGHWAKGCPNPHRNPRGPCPKCHREGHWSVDCPRVFGNAGATGPEVPQADLLGLALED